MNMKIAVSACLALSASQAHALPCLIDTLAGYIGLGAAGCQIGTSTVSGFTELTTIPAGATLVSPANILVTPVSGGPQGIGIDFGLNLGPSPNQFLDFPVSYLISGNSYISTSLRVDGVPPVDGVLSAITNLCGNGTFPSGIGSCTGAPDIALAAAQLAGDTLQTDVASFMPVSSLAIITDVGIDTGSVGTLSLASVGNRFVVAPTAVTLPSVLALLVAGLGALGLSRRNSPRTAAWIAIRRLSRIRFISCCTIER